MKRFLALALILVLVLAMVPASSMAEEYAPQTPGAPDKDYNSTPSVKPEPPKPVEKPPVKEELTAERYVPVPYVLNVADTEDGILAGATAHVGGESDSDGGELYTPDTWLMGLMLDKVGSIDADRREIAFTLNSAAIPSAVRGIAVYEGGEAGESEKKVRAALGALDREEFPENSQVKLSFPGGVFVSLPASALGGSTLEVLVTYYADRIAVELKGAEGVDAYVGIPAAEGAQYGSIVDGEACELAGSLKTVGDKEYFVSALADISGGVIIRLS